MTRKEAAEAKNEAVRNALRDSCVPISTNDLCWRVDQDWCVEPPAGICGAYTKPAAMLRVLKRIVAVRNSYGGWYLP